MDEQVKQGKNANIDEEGAISDAWKGNIKRTYDAYQGVDLDIARLNVGHIARVQAIAEQQLANLVNVCNMANLQAVAHRDIAIDSEWVPGPGEENIPPVDNTKV